MLQGSKGRSWMLAKNGQLSCTTPLVTAGGMEGRGGPILCVKIVRGQSTIQVTCEAPSVYLRPRGGSLNWALWELRLPGHSGGTAGWANQEAATAMPGMLPAAVCPPQAVGVSMQDAASLCTRQLLGWGFCHSSLFISNLAWTPLWHWLLWTIIVVNFKSKLLANISAGTWIKEITT